MCLGQFSIKEQKKELPPAPPPRHQKSKDKKIIKILALELAKYAKCCPQDL